MKMLLHSFKFLFFVLYFLSQNMIIQSDQQLRRHILNNYYEIELTQVTGPESIAFDCKIEGPYVGVSDGRILKWQGPNLGWKEFTIPSPNWDRKMCDGSTNPDIEPKCGRPLGLKFNHMQPVISTLRMLTLVLLRGRTRRWCGSTTCNFGLGSPI